MTSEQVRLILTLLTVVAATCLTGCVGRGPDPATIAPYGSRQVWAVVPLRNESGSRFADSYRIADRLVWEFEEIQGIDVLPVNRVLQAMQALGLQAVTTREDALALREVLGVDGLIVGSITAYDPYDPLRLGLSLDLYTGARAARQPLDIRGLSWAPTSDAAGIQRDTLYRDDQPVATVSGVFTASSPAVKERIEAYAEDRGTFSNEDHHRRLITIDMNLYTEFVSHEIGSQLIWAEWQRSARETAQSATQQRADAQEPPPHREPGTPPASPGRSVTMPEPTQPKTPSNAGQPGPAAPGEPAQVVPLGDDQIALVKNGKRHVFTCAPGQEPEVLNQIAMLVTDPANGLTWFDAAVLSHQLGERMSARLKQITGRRKSA